MFTRVSNYRVFPRIVLAANNNHVRPRFFLFPGPRITTVNT